MNVDRSSLTASARDLKVLASLLGYSQYGATPTFVIQGMSYEERDVLLNRLHDRIIQPFLTIHDHVEKTTPSIYREQISLADRVVTLSFASDEINVIRDAIAFALADLSSDSFVAAITGDTAVARQWHELLDAC